MKSKKYLKNCSDFAQNTKRYANIRYLPQLVTAFGSLAHVELAAQFALAIEDHPACWLASSTASQCDEQYVPLS